MQLVPFFGQSPFFDWTPFLTAVCTNTVINCKIVPGFGSLITVNQTFYISINTTGSGFCNQDHPDLSSCTFRYEFPQAASSSNSSTTGFGSGSAGAVVSFTATLDDTKTIYSTVKPANLAGAEYNEAITKSKNMAGLVTQTRDDIHTINLGNIPSGSQLTTQIVFFQGLEYDTQYNGHRLTIPTTLFPRYGYFNAVNEAPHSSKHSLFIKVTCEELEFQSNKEFDSDFICLSHNDAVIDENIVRYSTQENVTDLKDFVLIIKPKDVQRPDLIAIHDTLDPSTKLDAYNNLQPGDLDKSLKSRQANTKGVDPVFQNLLAVSFSPNRVKKQLLQKSLNSKELIFIIDCSGSMFPNMNELRDALRLYLLSLPIGPSDGSVGNDANKNVPIYFNMIKFGSRFKSLWKKSQPLTEKSFKEAQIFASNLEADMGGTEIWNPMNHAIENLRVSKKFSLKSRFTKYNTTNDIDVGFLVKSLWAKSKEKTNEDLTENESDANDDETEHEIILLTDGEVYDYERISYTIDEAVKEFKGKLRVHSIGVGSSVSHALLNTVARSGLGTKQHILNNERMEIKISRMAKLALSSPITSVNVYWELENSDNQLENQTTKANLTKTNDDDEFEFVENFKPPLKYTIGDNTNSYALEDLKSSNARIIVPESSLLPCHAFCDSTLYIFFPNSVKIGPSIKVELCQSDDYKKPDAGRQSIVCESPVSFYDHRNDFKDEKIQGNDLKFDYLFYAAAKLLLSDLELMDSRLQNSNATKSLTHEDIQVLGEKIGTDFGILSKWTSLVAIEKTLNKETGTVDETVLDLDENSCNNDGFECAPTGLFGSSGRARSALGSSRPMVSRMFGAGMMSARSKSAVASPPLFGATQAVASPSLFGAAPAVAPSPLFGAAPAVASPPLFGAAQAIASPPLFGAAPAVASPPLFGAAPASAPVAFGQTVQASVVTAACTRGYQDESLASKSIENSATFRKSSLFGMDAKQDTSFSDLGSENKTTEQGTEFDLLNIITKAAQYDGSFSQNTKLMQTVFGNGDQKNEAMLLEKDAKQTPWVLSLAVWVYLKYKLAAIEEATELLCDKIMKYVESEIQQEQLKSDGMIIEEEVQEILESKKRDLKAGLNYGL